MNKVSNDLEIEMNYANEQDHIPEAECNIRTIKEQVRVTYHCFPYKALPKVMIRYLAMISARQLKIIPVKHGILSYYSPHTILTHEQLDYNKHCKVPFGSYEQVNQERNKGNQIMLEH